jgi:hypothetical protein
MRASVVRSWIVLARGQPIDDTWQWNWLSAISAKDATVVLNLRF